MTYKYATQNMTEKMAKAVRTSLAVSTKQSVEISKFIKGRTPANAIALLESVLTQKTAVPYTRFNWDIGHKKGIGPGRYPQKASTEFISLIKLAVANATDIGLNVNKLRIFNVVSQKGAKKYRHGRHRGQKAKHTHLEIVLVEAEPVAKPAKKAVSKTESAKPVEAKVEPKIEPKAEARPKTESAPKVEAPKVAEKAEAKPKTESAPKVEAQKVVEKTEGSEAKAPKVEVKSE